MVLIDPLFGLPGNHIDEFFAVRMSVKGVAVMGWHRDPDGEKFVGGDDIGAAKPFHVGPRVGFPDGVGILDESIWGG